MTQSGRLLKLERIKEWEKELKLLLDRQKYPMIAFIYESEVMREGHIGFLDLHSDYITVDDVITAMEILDVSDKFINNLKDLPKETFSMDEIYENCADEKKFEKSMEELDIIYDKYDNNFYKLGNEEIVKKILIYVRTYHNDFFIYE